MFTSIVETSGLTVTSVLLCTAASLFLGLAISMIYSRGETSSKNFVITLALLPSLVQAVIMMVSGNLGTGVAVAGTFSLVRFRSAPGSSREIASIFFAMAVGLATGMGYVTFAFLFTAVLGLALLVLSLSPLGNAPPTGRELRITIPEALDYPAVFDDLFTRYTRRCTLHRVKTTNLGSMYELTYQLTLKDPKEEKEFLDQLRCRNGNLTIVCGRQKTIHEEL